MLKLLLPLVVPLAVGFLSACAGSADDSSTPAAEPAADTPTAVPAQETPLPPEPPGGAGGGGDFTPVPITTPFPSPSPVPADWAIYSKPTSEISPAFTFSYPPAWFVGGGEITDPRAPGLSIYLRSRDPSTWDKPGYPPNSINVDILADPAAGLSGCGGALDRAPGTTGSDRAEDFVLASDAAPATLGGVPGGQVVRLFDPSTSGGLTRIHATSAVYNGICFNITAYFAQENPDEETFSQIASSFRFIK